MSLQSIKYNILLHLKNIPAPSAGKKIVIIESDDHGSIRMPNTTVHNKLKSAGFASMDSKYNLYDTLEEREDLEQLFDTLRSVKDVNGRAAVFCPFVNVANPDFEKIKASGYSQYFYEPFTATLERYGRDPKTMEIWRQGMEEGIFMPEYHGREHVSVQPWLQKLQEGNKQLLMAFDYGFVSVAGVPGIHSYAEEFRPEFYFTNDAQKPFLHQSIIEGVQLFEKLFGYTPSSFMPSNSVFHPDFEGTVYKAGIPLLNVWHKSLRPAAGGALAFSNYTNKQKIKKGVLNYYIRNCGFEPTDEKYTSPAITLKQVEAAFRLGKAAIICTHRANFTGALHAGNRKKGLEQLGLLLKEIIKRWPDTEFMSTKDFTQLLLAKA